MLDSEHTFQLLFSAESSFCFCPFVAFDNSAEWFFYPFVAFDNWIQNERTTLPDKRRFRGHSLYFKGHCLIKEAEKWTFKSKIWKLKISSFVIKKPQLIWGLTYFNKVKFARNFRSCSKNWIKKQNGRFVAMVTKDVQALNLKFDQVMFNSLVLTWERNFEVTFGIFSVLVFQICVLESYLDIYLF